MYFREGSGQSLQSVNRQFLAETVVERLQQLDLDPDEQCKLDTNSKPPVPAPIGFIYLRGLPGEVIPRWQVVAPGWSKEFQPSDVKSLLVEKNAIIHQYRETVPEIWLLI